MSADVVNEAADVLAICASNWRNFLEGPYPDSLTDSPHVIQLCHDAVQVAVEEWAARDKSGGVDGYGYLCAIAECQLRTAVLK